MRSMSRGFVLAAVVLGGCIPPKLMPLQVGGKLPDLSKKSVLVMRVTVRNDNKPEHQPVLASVVMNRRVSGSDSLTAWMTPTLVADQKQHGKEYLASVEVEPGPVRLSCVSFRRTVPLLLVAQADAYLDADIEVPPGKVVYLGALDAVIVPRPQGSTAPRAGPMVPLIDQGVAGLSSGQWELAMADRFDADVALMKEKYPYLSDVEILRAVIQLPASGGTGGPIEPAVADPAVSTPSEDATAMKASDPETTPAPSTDPKNKVKKRVKKHPISGRNSYANMNPGWAEYEEIEVEE